MTNTGYDFTGKAALVTGGSKGIGRGCLSATRATRTFLPLLQRSDGAVIVNVSSIAGATTGAGDSFHYGVSKAALDTFTVGLARELKTVRVVGVAPSAIDTDSHLRHSTPAHLQKIIDQVPLGRIGTVREVVDVIAFLASGHAAYVSGSVVKISAGR